MEQKGKLYVLPAMTVISFAAYEDVIRTSYVEDKTTWQNPGSWSDWD